MGKRRIEFIRPKRPNRYLTETDTEPIRRPQRAATPRDRIYIFVFVYIAATVTTAVAYLYFALGATMPLGQYVGNSARLHFILVCLGGGLLGVIGYAALSRLDPYGTVQAEKARAEERQKLAKLREEARQWQSNRSKHQPPDK